MLITISGVLMIQKKLKTAAPVTRNDIEKIMSTCLSIIDHYSETFDGEHLSITTIDRFDVIDVFDLIKLHLDNTKLRRAK